ncbi:MAG: ATP-binding protein [Kiritimatiellae bacterium]|nr:ATP-binding protein [Kiritimatiellia bacterium]MDD5519430.1 ATP-binding protein [Kiritimatiellia bacterium]
MKSTSYLNDVGSWRQFAKLQFESRPLIRDLLFGTAAVLLLTLVSLCVERWTGYWSIALFYLALVVFLAMRLSKLAVMLVSILTWILWNFLFIPPRFTFRITQLNDALMFAIYLLVALAMGHVTAQLRWREETERRREQRTHALYRLVQCVIESTNLDEALRQAVRETKEISHGEVAIVLAGEDGKLFEITHPASSWVLDERERGVALWCHAQGEMAGRYTRNLPQAGAMFLPLTTVNRRAGVLALRFPVERNLHQEDIELFQAVADHVAAIIQRYDLARQATLAHLTEESQKLYRTLFSCVSHELKTPLAVIDAATRELRTGIPRTGGQALLNDIEGASLRLRDVVDKLLDMSRIESGRVKPDPSWCEVDELIETVYVRTKDVHSDHCIKLDMHPDLPAVYVDSVLLEHAVSNLVTNAAQYSGAGTEILVSVRIDNDLLIIDVSDQGPGIPEELLGQVFDKFSRGPNARRGGTGLGLAIVQGLIQALGGSVHVANKPEGGAMFSVHVPVKTTRLAEDMA